MISDVLDPFYGGLHYGDCFDLKVDNAWVPARIEMGGGNGYFAIVKGEKHYVRTVLCR